MGEYYYSANASVSYLSQKKPKNDVCYVCTKEKSVYSDLARLNLDKSIDFFKLDEHPNRVCKDCLFNGFEVIKLPQTTKRDAIKAFKDLTVAEML